ncbi:MAG: phosphatase PAP2 family protein [Acidimicrobiia bacterium]
MGLASPGLRKAKPQRNVSTVSPCGQSAIGKNAIRPRVPRRGAFAFLPPEGGVPRRGRGALRSNEQRGAWPPLAEGGGRRAEGRGRKAEGGRRRAEGGRRKAGGGSCFPSGHAMTSLVMYGALVLVVLPLVAEAWRPVLVAATGLVVLGIGVSRLVLGVHFITDVIGGWVLGTAWLSASTAAFSIWRVQEGDPPVHPSQGVEPEVV